MTEKWRSEIIKRFGKDAIKSGADLQPRGYRGSGSIALDVALGGGWGRRSIVQLMGRESSGKTLMFDLAAIEAQRIENARSLIFDFEGTYDRKRFVALGGNLDMLDVIDHESVNKPMLFAEDAVDICKTMFNNKSPHACICFDSTGAMVSVHQYDAKEAGGSEKQTMYSTARVMSEALPIIGGTMFKSPSEPTIFFVSQGRDNIGAMTVRGIPPRDKQTGGRALPFFATTRVNVKKGDIIKSDVTDTDTGRDEKQVEVGHKTTVIVWKNKMNHIQGRTAEFDVYNDGEVCGVDRVDELAQLAVYTRTVTQSGSWYDIASEFNVERRERVQGFDNLKDLLALPLTFAAVDNATRKRLAAMMDLNPAPLAEEVDEEPELTTVD